MELIRYGDWHQMKVNLAFDGLLGREESDIVAQRVRLVCSFTQGGDGDSTSGQEDRVRLQNRSLVCFIQLSLPLDGRNGP